MITNDSDKKFWFLCIGTLIAFTYAFCITFCDVPEANRELANLILGVFLGSCIKDAYNYLFGSTSDSHAKNETISKAVDTMSASMPTTANTSVVTINWLGSFDVAPLSPKVNDAYVDTKQNKNFMWNGSKWIITTQNPA